MSSIDFIKMHGLGNDFVVIDGRSRPVALSDARARAIADRRTGVGCDQLIILEPATDASAALFMRIHNADGGEVDACGNATRCIGDMVLTETGQKRAQIQTGAGLLAVWRSDGGISVDMGEAKDRWMDIPLAEEADTLHLEIGEGPLQDPVAVSVGNPHAVFFVEDAEEIDLAAVGPVLEHHPLYPERANVEAVSVLSRSHLRVRVWERGVGITRACGTGACAAAVAAVRRDLADRELTISLDGGDLTTSWLENGHIVMTGAVAESFRGTLPEDMVQ